MSTDARGLIVGALSTVEGLSATRSNPDVATAGAAWPRWVQTRFTGGKMRHLAVHDYDAMVVLPAGYDPDTVEVAGALLEEIGQALGRIGVVEVAEPVTIAFDQDQTSMPGLRIRITPRIC